MRRIDKTLQSAGSSHRQENYIGPLASTSSGGHNANVNNLYNSQVRNAKMMMPYGVSSCPPSGIKAQAIVNNNNDNVVVGVYDPSRPMVNTGDICLYSSGGCAVHLSSLGEVSINNGSASIKMNPSGGITISSPSEVSINCSSLRVNGQSMMVP